MYKWLTLLISALVCHDWSYGMYFVEGISGGASVGYRQDSLNWNISGRPHGPNILSELKWEDLGMIQAGVNGQIEFCGNWTVQGDADYAKIFRGKNHDSDYLKDNRRGEISRFSSNANKGEAFDLSGGLGYNVRWCFEELTLTPLVGYSYHEQHLRMFDGRVSVFNSRSVHAVLHNLHSNYRTRWYGPWLGAEMIYDYDCDFEFYGALQYHWLQYHAKGHWNLRDEFYDDFQHRANGYGILGTLGGTYQFADCWKGGVRLLYLDFRARRGRDRTFLEDEVSDSEGSGKHKVKIVAETRLNEVNWHSFRLEADVAYDF